MLETSLKVMTIGWVRNARVSKPRKIQKPIGATIKNRSNTYGQSGTRRPPASLR